MAVQSQQDWSFHLERQSLIRWFIVQSDWFIQHVHLGGKKNPPAKHWETVDPFIVVVGFLAASRDGRNSAATCSRNAVWGEPQRTWHETKSLGTPRSALFKMRKWFPVGGPNGSHCSLHTVASPVDKQAVDSSPSARSSSVVFEGLLPHSLSAFNLS